MQFRIKKVILNSGEVRNLLKSSGIAGICDSLANEIASAAGSGYAAEGKAYQKRYAARVVAKSRSAILDNLENNTLVKSLGVLENDD